MNHLQLAALVGAITLVSSAASASTLYGTEYNAATPIYTLDQVTGALTNGPATAVSDIGDLASSGADAVLWGIQIPSNTLYRFDAITGATLGTVPVTGSNAVTGAPEKIVSLAYDAKGKVLYGNSTSSLGGGTDLFRIDPGTGAATLVGNLQVDKMYALAFDVVGGYLYGANGETGEQSYLWKIDPANATALSVGALRPDGNFDLAFRPADNALFMASTGSFSLYTVDIATAATTLVGAYGASTNIAGLAFAVPEPQTYALMLAGLAGIAFVVRRRR